MAKLRYFFGKTVLITGAASGLGRALSLGLAHPNIDLILIDRNEPELQAVSELTLAHGGKALALTADITDREAILAMKKKIVSAGHKIDIVLHCAAITRLTKITEFSLDIADTVMSSNYGGTVNIASMFLKEMMESNSGHIVGISSMAACRGLPNGAYYSASKGAVNNFLESLRIDLRNHGVLVTNFIFGFINTPLNSELETVYKTPMIISPEKAAAIVIKNVSKKKRLVYGTTVDRILAMLIRNLPASLWDRICIKDSFRLKKLRVKTTVRRI